MSFQSFSFFVFLAVTAAVCLPLARRHPVSARRALTVACLVFYVWGAGWRGLVVLAAGTAVTAAALRYLAAAGRPQRRRRCCLAAAVVWHVAVLMVFKYTGFFTGGAVTVSWAPLGLSFFTFQQIWCLKEAYTGQFLPRPVEETVLYAFFFPSITSGPILRPGAFFPQLEGRGFLHPTGADLAAGVYAICCGTAKKVLLADAFGILVNNGWARLSELTAPGAWMVILGYTLQLYFDFSGYCDIAAGAARLLGVRLPVNFDSPYRALSVGEFWKRWHITLTTFLRECLYFPLGGSRRGKGRTYLHILIVFLVSGFWHGAGWTFLVWGALHALGQIIERAWGPSRQRLPGWLQWLLTFLFLNVAWVFFRAPSLAAAGQLLATAVGGGLAVPGGWLLEGMFSSEVGALQILLPALTPWIRGLVALALFAVGLGAALAPGNTIRRMDTFRPTARRAVVLWVLMGWSVLSFTGVTTFIYSNF